MNIILTVFIGSNFMPYKNPNSKRAKEAKKRAEDKRSLKRIEEKYSSLILKIQPYNISDKAIFLSNIQRKTRLKIYDNYIVLFSDQIEKEIKEIQRKNAKLWRKNRRINNWNYVKEWMTDRGCDCGENNISKLSFHHLDPSLKENTIRKMCKYNLEIVKKELEKGIVKCKNCHTIIHTGTFEEREKFLTKRYLSVSTDKRCRQKNKLLI